MPDNRKDKQKPKEHKTKKNIELMDSTLRDGEQTAGVSFNPKEKESLAFALYESGINRIEMASAHASSQDMLAIKNTTKAFKDAGYRNPVECLSFILKSHIDWIVESGATTANLLTKASTSHLTQLKGKTPGSHIRDILDISDYAKKNGLKVNAYLEHFSYGMQHSKEYIYELIDSLNKAKINRIMLADTMGILNPEKTGQYVTELAKRYPKTSFDIHAHNDYGLATANTLAAIRCGCTGAHVTVNGLGERAGNASLETVAVCLKDFYSIDTIDEDKLIQLSKLTKALSGTKIEPNHPVIGKNSHIHKAGVHTHGAGIGLYTNPLLEKNRFNKIVSYDLGKLSGKASVSGELEKIGIKNPDPSTVTQLVEDIKTLSENKNIITTNDLLLLYLQKTKKDEKGYSLKTIRLKKTYTEKTSHAEAEVTLKTNSSTYTETSHGDGGFDAIAKSIKKITGSELRLKDYHVTIPPGDGTSSLVDTAIEWEYGSESLKTRGIHTDQDIAATLAMLKAINHISMLKDFRKKEK
ncbi:MAG: alpha-isopropylmalate synthase regulatory domain-containing protein [archaeon]